MLGFSPNSSPFPVPLFPNPSLLDEATTVTPAPLTILGFGGLGSSIKSCVGFGDSCAISSSNVFVEEVE